MTSIPFISITFTLPVVINSEIFAEWVAGSSESDIINAKSEESKTCSYRSNALVESQYRLFDALESHLKRPKHFMHQKVYFPLTRATKLNLIEQYFSIEPSIIRELVARKLVGKTRRDLEEVSRKSSLSLMSCRRQFDNLRAIVKCAEESPENIFKSIKQQFLLSNDLIKKYSAIIFLNHHQIQVGGNTLLDEISISVLLDCATSFISFWSMNETSLIVELRLAHLLRDLHSHVISISESELDILLLRALAAKLTNFSQKDTRLLYLNSLSLGASLLNRRSIQDLLTDICDKIVKPIKNQKGIQSGDANVHFIFEAFAAVSKASLKRPIETSKHDLTLIDRYYKGLDNCVHKIVSNKKS